MSFCKEPGKVFVWSFQLRHLRVVSGYRRNMGYLRVDCRAVVFAHLVALPCSPPCGRPIIKTCKPSVRGLPGVGQAARAYEQYIFRLSRKQTGSTYCNQVKSTRH